MIELYITDCNKSNEHEKAELLVRTGIQNSFGKVLELCHDERGKPFFADADDIFVSISHSRKFCVAALSDGQIGVDIEAILGDEDKLLRIAKRYFTADEYEYMLKDIPNRFFSLWCAKESYVKYTGKGLSKSLSTFSILSKQGIEESVRFSSLIYKGHMITVCSGESWMGELKYLK